MGTPAAEPEISLGAPLAEAKSTHWKTRRNSGDFGTGSAADANSARMAEMDPVVQMAQKNVLARHLPRHCETLVRLGLGLRKILNICTCGLPQTGVSSMRNAYFWRLGISAGFWSSEPVDSCPRNAHFQKHTEKHMQPRWRQLPQKPPRARLTLETQNNIAQLCGQMRFFLAMPGRDLRLQITGARTKSILLIRCRLVRAKRTLLKHLKIASAESVVWPTPNTLF